MFHLIFHSDNALLGSISTECITQTVDLQGKAVTVSLCCLKKA